jgi:hypothetical protein
LNAERVPQGYQAKYCEAGHDVGHSWYSDYSPQKHRCQAPNQASHPGGLPLELALGDDYVSATFDPAYQVGNKARCMGKIRMHEDRGVPLWPVSPIHGQAEQLLHTGCVSPPLLMPEHGQREHPGIPLEHFSR